MSNDEKRFRFGTREVIINSKQELMVEKLIDKDIIKSYLVKSKSDSTRYAWVQCTKKYFIVLYFGQECGYVENKREHWRELFEFSSSENMFFDLKKYMSTDYTYDYENEDKNNVKILSYDNGIFYINSKGYTHNEKERA